MTASASSSVVALDGRTVVWSPWPRQEIALTCPVDELMYGGAKGGGKSDFLLMAPVEQIALADRKFRETGLRQRGRAVLFRKNLKRLDELIMRSKELFPVLDPQMGSAGFVEQKKRWTFSSGYVFDFDHLDSPTDHEAYQGQEITALLIDQAEEIAFAVVQYLVAQIRSKDADMRKLLMFRCTANPGGTHAQWVKDYFVSPHRAGNKVLSDAVKLPSGRTRTVTRAFIPAKLSDNPSLDADPAYEAQLAKLPEHMRRMYLDGDWDVVIGSFFAGVFDKRIHVIPPFPIPPSWEVRFGMDWGTVAPAACIFGTRDNDGNLYLIDEMYGPGRTGRTFADRFKKKLETQQWSDQKKWTIDDIYGLLDYEAWSKRGEEGPTAAVSMQNAGMRLFKANKNRAAGMEQLLERFSLTDGYPKIYIFEGRCPNLIRTIDTIKADDKNPNDTDTDGDDHALDACRYLCMDWPVGGKPDNDKGDQDVERWMALAHERDKVRGRAGVTGYDYE